MSVTMNEDGRRELRELIEAAETAKSALNICLRYFLGTGPQPDPDDVTPGVQALSNLVSTLKAWAIEAKREAEGVSR